MGRTYWEMGLSGPQWTSPGWPVGGSTPGAMAAGVALQPGWRPPLPGDGSATATCPVDDVHQARANGGVMGELGTACLEDKGGSEPTCNMTDK